MIIKNTTLFLLSLCLYVPNVLMAAGSCESKPPSNKVPDFAQCVAISDNGRLNIAVRDAPPFVYEIQDPITKEKKLTGIAVDLWEAVAKRSGIDYQYVCKGLSDTLTLLESGEIDMAISPLTITKEREAVFDFSHQYFNSGLVFASTPAESSFDFKKALNTLTNTLISKNVLYLFVFFILLLIVMVFFALRNLEHYQEMPIMKNKSKAAMVTHVVLYSSLNISGIRQDVFGFSSIGMQLLSFLIMIFGITVSASLFSMVTAALTQSVTPQKIYTKESLPHYSVSTLQGSTAQGYLCSSDEQPADLALTSTWKEALQAVVDKKQDVVIGDWVQLVYLSQKPAFKNKITVYDQSFKFEPYGWGLKTNHPRKDVINQELIGLLREDVGVAIVKKYIGSQQINMQSH